MENIFANPPLYIDKLPQYQDLNFEKISIKYRTYGFLRWGISLLIFTAFFLSAALFLDFDRWILSAVGGFLILYLAIRFFIIWKEQGKYGFALRERDIAFSRGYLVNKVTVIPFERIQHVSTSQSILENSLHIATLHIFTAGGSGSDISIPGLAPDLAHKIKDTLVLKVDTTS